MFKFKTKPSITKHDKLVLLQFHSVFDVLESLTGLTLGR